MNKGQLEKLLFFNPFQLRYLKQIDDSIKYFGMPRIVKSEKGLHVVVEHLNDAQTLFVLDDKSDNLIGVIIFFRENVSTITLLHIALNETYITYNQTDTIVLKLIYELKKILRPIKGVDYLKVIYSSQFSMLKVR